MDYDKEFQYKEELVAYAKERGVSSEGTRAEITERLVAQDAINAAAEEDSEAAQAIEVSDKPIGEVPTDVMTSKTFKVDRTKKPAEEAPTAPEAEKSADGRVLVKMIRRTSKFHYGNVRFTRNHPYALVSEAVADSLINGFTGFRRATKDEAKEHYGLNG